MSGQTTSRRGIPSMVLALGAGIAITLLPGVVLAPLQATPAFAADEHSGGHAGGKGGKGGMGGGEEGHDEGGCSGDSGGCSGGSEGHSGGKGRGVENKVFHGGGQGPGKQGTTGGHHDMEDKVLRGGHEDGKEGH